MLLWSNRRKYLHFTMLCSGRHVLKIAHEQKPSSKEHVMKISKRFQLQNAECINQ